jgi:hypothetical protein
MITPVQANTYYPNPNPNPNPDPSPNPNPNPNPHPHQANTYYPGDFIPITWQSYFVSGNEVG